MLSLYLLGLLGSYHMLYQLLEIITLTLLLTTKIAKQWHLWAPLRKHRIFVSLMSPRTRVLVICSEIERSTRAWGLLLGPPSPITFSQVSWKGGHNLGFIFQCHVCHALLTVAFGCLHSVAFGCLYSVLYPVERLAKRVVCMPSH